MRSGAHSATVGYWHSTSEGRLVVNRIVNVVVSLPFTISVIVSRIGRKWAYYILGSIVEAILLGAIARSAWRPPPAAGMDG